MEELTASQQEIWDHTAPPGACDECGTQLVDHRVQCPQGEDCTYGGGLLWCPKCEEFSI